MDALGALRTALARIRARGLALVQLRPKALTPEAAWDGDDYDFFCDPDDHARVLSTLAEVAREERGSYYVDATWPGGSNVLLWDDGRRVLPLDIWLEQEVPRGDGRVHYLRLPQVRPYLRRTRDGGLALPDDLGALLYLGHLEVRRKDPRRPAVLARLAHYRAALEAGGPGFLPGREAYARLLDRVAALAARPDAEGRTAAAAAATALLLEGGLAPDPRPLIDRFGERLRCAVDRRVRRRLAGPTIAFVGPDGAGKTTLISDLMARLPGAATMLAFMNTYRLTTPYAKLKRLIPAYWHGRNECVADDRFGLFLFPLALLCWFREARPELDGGRKVVLVDRYFHDLLIRGARSTTRPPRLGPLARLAARLFPLPDLIVQLYADPSSIRARKQEITPRNIELYERLCAEVYAGRPARFARVSTDEDPAAIRGFVAGLVERIARMAGLDGAADRAAEVARPLARAA